MSNLWIDFQSIDSKLFFKNVHSIRALEIRFFGIILKVHQNLLPELESYEKNSTKALNFSVHRQLCAIVWFNGDSYFCFPFGSDLKKLQEKNIRTTDRAVNFLYATFKFNDRVVIVHDSTIREEKKNVSLSFEKVVEKKTHYTLADRVCHNDEISGISCVCRCTDSHLWEITVKNGRKTSERESKREWFDGSKNAYWWFRIARWMWVNNAWPCNADHFSFHSIVFICTLMMPFLFVQLLLPSFFFSTCTFM